MLTRDVIDAKKAAAKTAADSAREVARQKAEAAKAVARAARNRIKHPAPAYFVAPDESGDPETDAKATLDAVADGFRSRARDEEKRFREATDSEYWFAACFQTREQKEVFLAAINVLVHGDKYIDGQVLADALGITIPAADVRYNEGPKAQSSWVKYVD